MAFDDEHFYDGVGANIVGFVGLPSFDVDQFYLSVLGTEEE